MRREHLDRTPPGLSGVFIVKGGTDDTSTAFATRAVPWRPM
jgi:hypothetical protein